MQWCLSGGRVCTLFISHCGGEGLPSSPVHLPSLSPTKLHHPVPPVSPRSECLRSLKGEEGQTLETKLSVHTGSSCCLTNTSCYSRSVISDATQTPHMLHNVDFHVFICHPHVSFSKESVQIISFFLFGMGASYIESFMYSGCTSFIWSANIFSQIVVYLFFLSTVPFEEKNFSFLMKSELRIYSFIDCTFAILTKNMCWLKERSCVFF